jgi:predicted nuclease with TOPRIM domain
MKVSQIRNIIGLHIEGYSYSEIAGKTGVARSTVQLYVEKWRNGLLDEYRDDLPYEEEVLEIAKYLRSNKMSIQDLREPLLNHQILKSLNIDLAELIKSYDVIRSLDSSVVPDLVHTIITMKERGIDYPNLASDADRLINERKNMEDENNALKTRLEETRTEISLIEDSKVRAKNELKEIMGKSEAAHKEIKKIEEKIAKNKETIDISDKIKSLASALGIDLPRLEGFMRDAMLLGYDAKAIGSMKMLQDLTFEMGIGSKEINKFYTSLTVLLEHGWDDASISELTSIVSSVGETPEDALDLMRSYASNKNAIRDKNSELLREQRDLENKTEELRKKTDDLAREFEQKRSYEMKRLSEEEEAESSKLKSIKETRAEIEDELSRAVGQTAHLSMLTKLSNLKEEEISKLNKEKGDLLEEMVSIKTQITRMSDLLKFANGMRVLLTSDTGSNSDVSIMMKNICSREMKGDLSYSQRETLRLNMIDLFLKLFQDRIVPVVRRTMHFIKRADYDLFIPYKDRLLNLNDEVSKLEDLKKSYGMDMRSMIQDALSGSNFMDSAAKKLVLSFAEEVMEKKIDMLFQFLRTKKSSPYNPGNSLFLMGTSETGEIV